jgi:Uma2 family endonuclease
MTTVETRGSSDPFTVNDLGWLPFGARRYELLDGMLIVTALPDVRHQAAVVRLVSVLDQACPVGMRVLMAPLAVRANENTQLQPDVLVALDGELLSTAPLLVMEVSSPDTALTDSSTKKAAYERMGVQSYWILAPTEARLTVFELDRGVYTQIADIKGEDVFEAELPFPVRIVPAELLGTLWGRA